MPTYIPYATKECKGFTLIELLVVISIVALLVTIMLPALGRVRGSAQTTQCLSNQRGMMAGWSSAMIENKDLIPYILNADRPPLSSRSNVWWGLLADQFSNHDAPQYGRGPDASNPGVCPTIDITYDRPFYSAVLWGYSVNARWSACGELGDNQLRKWSTIPTPTEYPWLADPHVADKNFFVTDAVFGDLASFQYGLGFEHHRRSGNAVYADGHAETYQADVLSDLGKCNVPRWLVAIKD